MNNAIVHSSQVSLTKHAEERMDARSINAEAIDGVMCCGRVVYANKARIYFIGRKEVRQNARQGIDISAWEGIHVVTSLDGVVITTYRNRDIRHLRPRRRAKHAYH
jgi:hypothetical protein